MTALAMSHGAGEKSNITPEVVSSSVKPLVGPCRQDLFQPNFLTPLVTRNVPKGSTNVYQLLKRIETVDPAGFLAIESLEA